MRVALVHDWLITWRGGEKVLEALAGLFPSAEIFTLFHEPGSMSPALEARTIHTAFVDKIPGARRRHRQYLPLLPLAIERLSLEGYDLIISSSHCVAKGVRKPRGANHLSYVHAPMRYMWDHFDEYFGPGRVSVAVRAAALALRPVMQRWDVKSADGVDRFVANSANVSRQIARRYGRRASVVYPPAELERFSAVPLADTPRSYFLCLGALAPYKRIDLAIAAFTRMGLPLWVGGTGQKTAWLRSLPPNIKALGQVPDADLPELFRGARALVFPGEDDLGLTPIEAQASGRPVIAYGRGGALETVTAQTGIFFGEQTVDALVASVGKFESTESTFSPAAARANASRFSLGAFQTGMRAQLAALGVTVS
jgi:glycosyltransferase involved in cell wall biosynthesis